MGFIWFQHLNEPVDRPINLNPAHSGIPGLHIYLPGILT